MVGVSRKKKRPKPEKPEAKNRTGRFKLGEPVFGSDISVLGGLDRSGPVLLIINPCRPKPTEVFATIIFYMNTKLGVIKKC
jgi:Ni,Fe-hydrogenase III small subunit